MCPIFGLFSFHPFLVLPRFLALFLHFHTPICPRFLLSLLFGFIMSDLLFYPPCFFPFLTLNVEVPSKVRFPVEDDQILKENDCLISNIDPSPHPPPSSPRGFSGPPSLPCRTAGDDPWCFCVCCRLPIPRPGEVLGLVGTNGIGKSTALKILAGKQKPNLGKFDVSFQTFSWTVFIGAPSGIICCQDTRSNWINITLTPHSQHLFTINYSNWTRWCSVCPC